MLVKKAVDIWEKLVILGVHAKYDVCSRWDESEINVGIPGIYFARTPSGKFPLLKVLFTNVCFYDCNYCSNRAGRDRVKRVSFDVFELVRITEKLFAKGAIKGIFLSSGVGCSPEETFVRMGEVVRLLRKRGFRGYIHLKVLPGVGFDAVKFYSRFASRLSYNLEAPSGALLSHLTGNKDFNYAVSLLKKLSSFTTQFIVDYRKDRDIDYLKTVEMLSSWGLKRAYFKAFEPIPDTPFEGLPPGRRLREHRLYQAEYLIRGYGFKGEELVKADGNMDLKLDPKEFWARKNPEVFPVDLARSDFEELIKVPGIGPKTAKRIISLRRKGELDRWSVRKVLPFYSKSVKYITFKGKRLEDEDGDSLRMLPLFSQAGS
ncbi:MAG: hypothetical protein GXO44_03650 [Deferribacteres bacterium]|nr:hypothetical protein [Deferribacteres bacterium]